VVTFEIWAGTQRRPLGSDLDSTGRCKISFHSFSAPDGSDHHRCPAGTRTWPATGTPATLYSILCCNSSILLSILSLLWFWCSPLSLAISKGGADIKRGMERHVFYGRVHCLLYSIAPRAGLFTYWLTIWNTAAFSFVPDRQVHQDISLE
jgi:hypothetical protein